MPSLYAILLAPLQLPVRALEALDLAGEAAREIRPIHSELSQMREQTKPLAEIPETIASLDDDVERITDRLPDPDGPGPVAKARNALTGS